MFQDFLSKKVHVAQSFKQFKAHFPNYFETDEKLLEEIIDYYLTCSGKMIRPLTWFLLNDVISQQTCQVLKSDFNHPAAIEMVHMATLLHDDVIDQADFRRHQDSVRHLWGNSLSVLAGDFLSSRAFMLIADYPSIFFEFAGCINVLSEGEIAQERYAFDIDLSVHCYFEVIRKKTAILFELIAKMVCLKHAVDQSLHQALVDYSYYLGMMFQLCDDLLDYQSMDQILGKPSSHDLFEGKITLPLILAMQESKSFKNKVANYIKSRKTLDLKTVLEAFPETNGFSKASEYLQIWRNKAQDVLIKAEFSKDQRQNLLLFLNLLVDRKF